LKVYGSVGDDAKLEYLLKDLGFDGGFNYKKDAPKDILPKLIPQGIGIPYKRPRNAQYPLKKKKNHWPKDIYFENVGGETLDAVLVSANKSARIVACGMISEYGQEDKYGVKNLGLIVGKQIRFQGFIQTDLREQYLAVPPPHLFSVPHLVSSTGFSGGGVWTGV
jgi:NADPH-dependent curcumin reductase CurA